MPFITESQRDPRWANKVIAPGYQIGKVGCTVTSISMLSFYFGDNLTPDKIVDICKFTNQGLVIWTSCNFTKFAFERREYGRNEVNINQALKDPNRAVILNVAQGSHWVVATGHFGTLLKIADPWLGDMSTMARYKNDIEGASYFRKI